MAARRQPITIKRSFLSGLGALLPGSAYNRTVGTGTAVPHGPWTRLPEEPSYAHMCFEIYRRLGPTRSLNKVHSFLKELKEQLVQNGNQPTQGVHPSRNPGGGTSDICPGKGGLGAGRARAEGDGGPVEGGPPPVSSSQVIAIAAESPVLTEISLAEVLARRLPPSKSLQRMASRHDWVNRARAWDDWVWGQAQEAEREARRQDAIARAADERLIRGKFREIVFGLLDRILAAIASGAAWTPKELRELTLAAERAGLVRDNAFAGVRDLLAEDAQTGGVLDIQVAMRLTEAMAGIALEHQAASTPPGLPPPDAVVLPS